MPHDPQTHENVRKSSVGKVLGKKCIEKAELEVSLYSGLSEWREGQAFTVLPCLLACFLKPQQ